MPAPPAPPASPRRRAEHVGLGDPQLVEEDLVEVVRADHAGDRAHLDRRSRPSAPGRSSGPAASSPLCDVRVRRKHHCAIVAYEVQIFWPETNQPSPSRRAAVWTEARSEPALGSLNPWHQIDLAPGDRGEVRRCCSGVPWRMIVGPTQFTPMYWAPRGSWCAHISSRTAVWTHGDAPLPPHSSGQATQRSPPRPARRQKDCATSRSAGSSVKAPK